jgi:hypothetical protein
VLRRQVNLIISLPAHETQRPKQKNKKLGRLNCAPGAKMKNNIDARCRRGLGPMSVTKEEKEIAQEAALIANVGGENETTR